MAGKESPQLASLTARDKELATAALLALKGNWDVRPPSSSYTHGEIAY